MKMKMNKRTIPVSWAIMLVALVAIIGTIAFYIQYDRTRELSAASEEALADQKYQALVIFDKIEKNLAKIREHESMIQQDFTGPDKNGSLAPEERIQREINFIKYLLDQNNSMISSLEDQLTNKDHRLSGYEQNVKDLKARISGYEIKLNDLIALKDSLMMDLDRTMGERNDLVVQVNQLGKNLEEQDSVILDQRKRLYDKDIALHAGYYTMGTYKDLRDRKVIEKEGGFLGINRVTTLVDNPASSQFEVIDTRDVMRFPIFSKRFEIISDRDPSSYKVEYSNDRAEWLTVTNPEKFWKKSRYLVIVVRDNVYEELAHSR